MKNEIYIEFGHSNIKVRQKDELLVIRDLKEFSEKVDKTSSHKVVITDVEKKKNINRFYSSNDIPFKIIEKDDIDNVLKYDYDIEDLGIDRILMCEYVRSKYGDSCIVLISFGTAITFNILIRDSFKGGAIIPSAYLMYRSLKELSGISSKIEDDLSLTDDLNYYSRNTQESVSGGITNLIKSNIESHIRRFPKALFIATGGGAEHRIVLEYERFEYSKDLLLSSIEHGRFV